MPRPSSTTARLNRQNRARKLRETNRKRTLAVERLRKRLRAERDKIRKEKDFIRTEKLKIKASLKQQRDELAAAKKQAAQKKKVEKKMLSCSDQKASDISIAMSRLVPTSAQISTLTHKQYVALRTKMSKTLTQVRQYADRCNKTYVVEKKKSSPKRPTPALHIPNRQTFIPDIGESVPDECPVDEEAFNAARRRLNSRRNPTPVPKKKKKKKRIAPTLLHR